MSKTEVMEEAGMLAKAAWHGAHWMARFALGLALIVAGLALLAWAFEGPMGPAHVLAWVLVPVKDGRALTAVLMIFPMAWLAFYWRLKHYGED